ncbi:FAD-dependent oxidoreductase [bacterium]|nr:FAD-dependent oxidoreductase [bacterium]
MDTLVGTESHPLRVAIIGSGPSGFYAADHLLKQKNLIIEVDMFERLPTPYGLVRGGVAPDHQKIKAVTKVYEKIAQHPSFRFYGNVTFGKDILHEDMRTFYHAVIYAVGAQSDRQMGIPGENLSGSHAATEFVAWYNGHPDYQHFEFDLSQERVAVIGNGNVAMDVARILASSYEELRRTDIADEALAQLKTSRVREIYLIGRRGPAQAAFTNPEIKELGELESADVYVNPDEIALDNLTREAVAVNPDATVNRNIEILTDYSLRALAGKSKKIIMKFLWSPVELIGHDKLEAIKLVKNQLHKSDDGSLRPKPTDRFETLPVGLVFRSIGYKGIPLPGVPFDEKNGIIPNQQGRVIDRVGEYAVGWIKRGPSGVIGTNKPDSYATVEALLHDHVERRLLTPIYPQRSMAEEFLIKRNIRFVTFDNWMKIDHAELARGAAQQRPRIKFTSIGSMLEIIQTK